MPALPEKEPFAQESVEISFGTIFRVKSFGRVTDRTDVIIDVGKDTWFIAVNLAQENEGYTFIGFPGTANPEVFGIPVGRLTPEEVLEAAKKGAIRLGYELGESQINHLRTNSTVSPRQLKLTAESP
ncbi:MAG TPA: hypothetical protein VF828_02560 [Patescibacteria group bacterium]